MSTISASTTSTTAYKVTADTTGKLDFQTGSTPTTYMTLDGSGNLGVGTSSPSGALGLYRGASTSCMIEIAGNANTPGSTSMLVGQDATSSGYCWNRANSVLLFGTNNTERARIDSSGNLGVGTTSPTTKLQVVGTGRFSSGTEGLAVFHNGSVGYIETSGSSTTPIGFANGGVERARIDSSGRFLVGRTSTSDTASGQFQALTTSGGAILAVQPNNAAAVGVASISVTTGSTGWYSFVGQSGNGSTITTNTILIYGNGNVVNANNSYGGISDIKLKENIIDASPKLEKLCQVRVVNYNLKGDYEKHKQLGVIAQELEQVFPGLVEETVDKDAEGNELGTTTKQVKYSVFVPMLIKAIQEQQTIIETLTNRITALEAK